MGATPEVAGLGDLVEIGRGGFGVVYRATERDLERPVAVKVLFGALDEAARRRFDRERRAMGKVSDHPNVVTVYRTGLTDNGHPYIVMELMQRGSMRDRLERDGPIPWADAVQVGMDIATALEVAHTAGILHRDVKPGNLLVSSHGVITLADFGIAFISGTTETRSGVVTASLAHAAPEVVAGRRPDERSDLYSLGSTLYELVRGRAPFVRDDEESLIPMLARIARDPVPSLAEVGVPQAVCDVLDRTLAKDPAERPGSAAELRRDLAAARTASPPGAAQATTLFASDALAPPVGAQAPPIVGPPAPAAAVPPPSPAAAVYEPLSPTAGPSRPGAGQQSPPQGAAQPPPLGGSPSRADYRGPAPGLPSYELTPPEPVRRRRGRTLTPGVVGALAVIGFLAVAFVAIVFALSRIATPAPSESEGIDSASRLEDSDASELLDTTILDTTASGDDTTASGGDADTADLIDYDEYTLRGDDDGIILVELPAEWSDVSTAPASVIASERSDGFINSYEASGAGIAVFRQPGADLDRLLDRAVETGCDTVERTDYDDGIRFTGRLDAWVGCGDDGTTIVVHVIAQHVEDLDVVMSASVQITENRDFLAGQRFFDSIFVDVGGV